MGRKEEIAEKQAKTVADVVSPVESKRPLGQYLSRSSDRSVRNRELSMDQHNEAPKRQSLSSEKSLSDSLVASQRSRAKAEEE